jgi:hypothetical protein
VGPPPDTGGMGPPPNTSTGGMGPPPNTSGSNMTPASGAGSLTQQVCGLDANGQLVTATLSIPVTPNASSTTGQYCMSGGTLNGQCGTVTVANNSMQLCIHGQCTPSLPPGSDFSQMNAYNPAFFGVPASSPVVPCPSTTTTASSDPMGALGPPMMDEKTGKPTYHPSLQPRGQVRGSPAPQTVTVALPMPQYPPGGAVSSGSQNVCQPRPSQNVCQPKSATPIATPAKSANLCNPTQVKSPNLCNPTPAKASNLCNPSPPPKSSQVNLKPKPGTGDAQTASATPPKSAPLTLKPNQGTQMASAGSSAASNPCTTKTQVQACESKPPFLPWGGTGSATITVSGGKPCGIGWHDTGATILDSMSVSSPPSHGNLKPQDQHVIIFNPAPGYKGQDSFMLTMREHNGGRSATLRVKVSVTIQ